MDSQHTPISARSMSSEGSVQGTDGAGFNTDTAAMSQQEYAGSAATAKKGPSALMNKIAVGLGGVELDPETGMMRLGDIKQRLDASASDRDKLIAMKALMTMTSKGRDVSTLFPDVVKNVISKNVEVRKLVYMFLVYYAEVQPQEALLAINSLQKAMNDTNQLLRASALRCMSNIRVREIAQLIVLAVQKGAKDSSPCVRRTAAFAVPKILRLDPRHGEQCIDIIGALLCDNSTLVIGAAAQAYLEVCPTRFDLIHPCYRKICQVLPDIDEWGQVAVLTMMLRYGRSQFLSPDPAKQKSQATAEDNLTSDLTMDKDHRQVLQTSTYLLQSRNSAVVLATAVLHFYLAPPSELSKIAKPLIRLLHGGRETELIALTNIATMSAIHPRIFSDYVSDFFICGHENLSMRNLKLEVMTMLATEHNISSILKEIREYTKDEDKVFVASAIQAIGRCASAIPEVADMCLNQLIQLMANQSPVVVAESVVVVKKLLQANTKASSTTTTTPASERDVKILRKLSKMLNTIENAEARAAIIWLVGEYSYMVPHIAPDVLRGLAKTFSDEPDLVKLQVVTLGAKLLLSTSGSDELNPNKERIEGLLKYTLQMARYDQSYDIRDRARQIKMLLFNQTAVTAEVRDQARTLFLAEKPVPVLASPSAPHAHYNVGTLSHIVHDALNGYEAIPEFPEVMPDPTVRNPPTSFGEQQPQTPTPTTHDSVSDEDPFGKSDGWGGELGGTTEEPSVDEEAAADDEAFNTSDYLDVSTADLPRADQSPVDDIWGITTTAQEPAAAAAPSTSNVEEEDDDIWNPKPKTPAKKTTPPPPSSTTSTKQTAAPAKPAHDPLDDLFGPASPSTMTVTINNKPPTTSLLDDLQSLSAGFTSTPSSNTMAMANAASAAAAYRGPATGARVQILKPINAAGLFVECALSRRPSLLGADVATLVFYFNNTGTSHHKSIKLGKVHNQEIIKLESFEEVAELAAGATVEVTTTAHFTSLTTPAKFDVVTSEGTFTATLLLPPGDLVRPSFISSQEFASLLQKLSGLYKLDQTVAVKGDVNLDVVSQRIQDSLYVAPVAGISAANTLGFSAEPLPFQTPILINVVLNSAASSVAVSVHTENAVAGSLIMKQVIAALNK